MRNSWMMMIGIGLAAFGLMAADEGGARGGPGGLDGGRRGRDRNSAFNLERYGFIDTAQAQALRTQLENAIQRHNAGLLQTYDKNHDGKIDAEEQAALSAAAANRRSRHQPPNGGRGGMRNRNGNGNNQEDRPPEPPDGMGPPPDEMGKD